MAQSPAGKPRKTPKPAALPKKAAGSSASKPKAKPAPKAKPPAKPAPVPRKKPAPPPPPAPKKRAPAKKAAAKSPSPALADTTKVPDEVTAKQQRFVDEYMVDLNGTQAAIRAGYSRHTAAEQAYDLLRKPQIQDKIAEARRLAQERTQVTTDKLIRELALIALADHRELVEGRKGCCRHCWGEGFKAQYTIGEQNARMEAHAKKGGTPDTFNEEGGIGYNPHRPAHPDCPECMGAGKLHPIFNDTRYLSPAGVALYAGLKVTKEGMEVKVHSKLDAIEKLNRILGAYELDNKQKVDPFAEMLKAISASNSSSIRPVADDPELHQIPPGKRAVGLPQPDEEED